MRNSIRFYGVLTLIFCIGLLSLVLEAQAQPDKSEKTAFNSASGLWNVQKKNGKIVAKNSLTKKVKTVFTDINEEDKVNNYEIASLVGPVLSVSESLYWEGGAHPGHLARLLTVNLDTGQSPVRLTDLFPEEQIVAALLKDKIVKKSLGKQQPKCISEIIQSADGGCEISFYDINESYAFHHTKGDNIAIRIGLPHGCEVMRGNYTELGIYLPKPPQLAGFLEQADKQKTLQRNVRIKSKNNL